MTNIQVLWDVWWPREAGRWGGRGRRRDDGSAIWGLLDPETGDVELADPRRDRHLPGLAGALRCGPLVAYRPGRRAVVAVNGGFLKIVRPERARELLAVHERWRGAPRRVPWARPAPWPGVVWTSALAGQPVPFGGPLLRDAAGALAELHAQGLTDRPHRPLTAAAWARTVARAEPDLAARYGALAEAVGDPPTVGDACVHGDLHDKNVLAGSGPPSFIDLDSAARGAPEVDLGNLAAHGDLRALQHGRRPDPDLPDRIYEAYSLPIDRELAEAHRRATWFRLACIYRFRRAQHPTVDGLIALIEGARRPTGTASR